MEISPEKRQKAIRISKAIQAYMEQQGINHARSTDLYDLLVRKNLIEADIYQPGGLFFRKFLKELYVAGYLGLIPQCKCIDHHNGTHDWHFYKLSGSTVKQPSDGLPRVFVAPSGAPSREEIEALIEKSRPVIDRLPKKADSGYIFNAQQMDTRKNHKRAYEDWTSKELVYLERGFKKFLNVYAVADLLQRQPHVIEEKLRERHLL